MKKVLITGGAGFIGTNLTLGLLNSGYEVKVLDDLSTGLRQNISKDAEFVNASILESSQIIQAIEDCVLTELSFSSLQNLYKTFPETERLGRIITENYYIKLEERILSLQFKTAKERYQKLMQKKPSLIQRVSLGQIASYLGITQETLSRIRAEN